MSKVDTILNMCADNSEATLTRANATNKKELKSLLDDIDSDIKTVQNIVKKYKVGGSSQKKILTMGSDIAKANTMLKRPADAFIDAFLDLVAQVDLATDNAE